jgi:hypothetical protein
VGATVGLHSEERTFARLLGNGSTAVPPFVYQAALKITPVFQFSAGAAFEVEIPEASFKWLLFVRRHLIFALA